MPIKVGDKIPQSTFMTFTADGPTPVTAESLTAGKTVALFALPGAFTPTCSAKHVPGFVAHEAELKAKGVDTIACVSVNDVFVMNAMATSPALWAWTSTPASSAWANARSAIPC
jgi:peroxiredoxin